MDLENDQIPPEIIIEGQKVSYLTVISFLMYLMLRTCPDITYAVKILSHYHPKLQSPILGMD
ncbi:hypothetical protein PAXRUDRAFT_18141 [Paxillus rubicundulus Ve08.2h10]|uniref:Uncharacterized protein n=1 Tax=Paxillus rubicundulus Ve08.2h10 TaxID=930991 RepID=A0A0D0CZ57_9AGAM|nr:hypothetical protein PAXRUDRAFT_18141 [Paxillus rubicundulus Ve08.2h10]